MTGPPKKSFETKVNCEIMVRTVQKPTISWVKTYDIVGFDDIVYDIVGPDRQIASLTAQCRQVYCLVEMAPSAPSWRPPRNGVSSTASQVQTYYVVYDVVGRVDTIS